MNRARKHFILLFALAAIFIFTAPALAQQTVTIVGTVVGGYQIEDENGQVYEIGDNEKGEELDELYDSKVSVTGKLTEEDGIKTITVTSFKILEE